MKWNSCIAGAIQGHANSSSGRRTRAGHCLRPVINGEFLKLGWEYSFHMSTTSQPITDAYMQEMLGKTKPYTIMILHKTPKFDEPGTDKIVREHGRRNFELRRDGKLCIICPVRDESDVSGVGVFNTELEATRRIYNEDPGVKAGIFVYEIHSTRTSPGDALPK